MVVVVVAGGILEWENWGNGRWGWGTNLWVCYLLLVKAGWNRGGWNIRSSGLGWGFFRSVMVLIGDTAIGPSTTQAQCLALVARPYLSL